MTNQRSVSATAQDGWSVNPRGYISGGSEDTPVFLEVKQKFNADRTRRMRESKTSPDAKKRKYVQPVAVFGDPGFNKPKSHPIKES